MKICVFGAASKTIDEKYITPVEDMGEYLARHGHSLVFGAGSTGEMGAASRGFKRGGGNSVVLQNARGKHREKRHELPGTRSALRTDHRNARRHDACAVLYAYGR